MSRLRGTTVLGGLVLLAAGAVAASAVFAAESAQQQTVQGEIVDPAAYLKEGRHGPELTDQTYEAVDGGQTLALLETGTQTLYLLLADAPGTDPSELVYDYVNQQISVTGHVYERAGVRGIVVTSVNAPEASSPRIGEQAGSAAAPPSEPASKN